MNTNRIQSCETHSPSLYFETLFLGTPSICIYQIPCSTSQYYFGDFNARVSDELDLQVQKLTAISRKNYRTLQYGGTNIGWRINLLQGIV
jgi:hypothetical protein